MTRVTNRKHLTSAVSYLMVGAIAIRGLVQYPATRSQLVILLTLFIVLVLAEGLVLRLPQWIWSVYVIVQVVLMVILFIVEQDGDIWSITLLPACIFVMSHYRHPLGWLWIGVFSMGMIVMLVITHDIFAPQYIVIYLAAYLMVGSYALMLKQTEVAQQESQTLLRQLQEANLKLREYADRVEELTTIKERNRLARDLHDSVTQSIFSMTLITRTTIMLQERAPEQVTEKLHQLQGLAQGALAEMRGLIEQLRPISITGDGLYLVLEKHIDKFRTDQDISIELVIDDAPLPLDASQEQELFRIIQESLNNIAKHAEADHVAIKFMVSATDVELIISDDGKGFDHDAVPHDRSHIGLASMSERAKELGGVLDIKSIVGQGTEIKVTIPILGEDRYG